MAREVRDYSGGAVDTTLTSSINSTDLAILIADATGWPSGGANGPFFVVIDYDLAGIEKVEVASRTGTTLTVANTGKRGVDDTTAASHSSGAKIRHCGTAQDMAEFNSHAFDTAQDDHTQYLDTTRHAAIVHTAAMLGTDSVGSDEIAADAVGSTEIAAGAVGSSELATDAVTAGKIATDGVVAGDIADGALDGSGLFAAGVVDSAALAANAVIAGKLADGAVDTTARFADAIVTMAKLASETSVDWSSTLTLTGVTLGTGGSKYAHYWKFGRLVLMLAGFELGTGGDVTATIQFSLPFTPVDLAGFSGSNAGGGFTAGTARDSSTQQRHSGIGAIRVDLNTATDYVVAGQSIGWAASTPFDWTNGDTLEIIAVFEATS